MTWGNVAGAAVGVVGGLLSKPKSTSTQQQEPAYLQNAEKSALDTAQSISTRPYTPYTGERVAGMTPSELSASNLATTGSEESRGILRKSADMLSNMPAYSSDALKKYENPYTDAVLTPQLREQNAQYERDKTSLNNSKAGAWGGDRAAFQESELERTHRNAIADVTGKTYSDAFLNAQNAFFTDSARRANAATALSNVGNNLADLNRSQIQDLMATGGLTRLLNQAKLDFNYQQFVENRDWSVTNLDPLLKSISASKGGNVTQTTTSQNNSWGEALGAAATVAGMYFASGKGKTPSNPSPEPNNNGGGSQGFVGPPG